MAERAFKVRDAARTDAGPVRPENEDAYLARPFDGLWAVADGMGGHAMGSWAARTLTDTLGAAALAGDMQRDTDVVLRAIESANRSIRDEGEVQGTTIGCTAAVLLLNPEGYVVSWVGDSRVYLWRDEALSLLTCDHTLVQEMFDRGHITADEAKTHPMGHVVSRAVGAEATVKIDRVSGPVQVGDLFLLCSDGLPNVASEAEITRALRERGPAACDDLMALCLARRAPDNVTMVAVACDEATFLSIGAKPA